MTIAEDKAFSPPRRIFSHACISRRVLQTHFFSGHSLRFCKPRKMCDTARKAFVIVLLKFFYFCDAQTIGPQFAPNNNGYPNQNLQPNGVYNQNLQPNGVYNQNLQPNGVYSQNQPNSNRNFGQPGVAYNVGDGRNSQNFPQPTGVGYNNYNDNNFDQRNLGAPNYPANTDQSARGVADGRNFPQNSGGRPLDSDFDRRNRFDGDIRRFFQGLDAQASQQCTTNVASQWNFETNINEATQIEAINAQQYYADFQHAVWEQLNKIGGDRNIADTQLYRQMRYYSVVGPAALPPDQLDRYNRLINDMLAIYNSASICSYKDHFRCDLRLQPDLVNIMAKSRNWEELQHVWTEWRRNSGQKMKDTYEQLVKVSNDAARLNNFTDTADYWSFPFESPALAIDLEDAWEEIKPLYEQLLTYVRRRLREFYGPERISRQAPLPSHVLGNMWAQSWTNIFDISQPYPGQTFLDVTPEMIKQGYAPVDLFRLAEDFFVSMNMSALPFEFWQESILQEPLERVILCQPSAWDFCNGRDFRIKMCANVNMKDLITAHHELAHIYYFINYKNQPKVFRDGANPAFHEAIGEAIGLSVGTPKHLQALGLVQASIDRTSVDINFLYSMALDKIAFLPFAFVMDKWRTDIFKGQILKEQYNCHWHRLREQYQGIKPPVLRSEIDFDPGAKYHVPANVPYHRYFVSTLLQFQIYRSLCIAAGQYSPTDRSRPLHECDIYRSKEAGRILTQLMEKGSSQPWRDVLFQVTGESRLSGNALREYFRPLEDWLINENLRTGEFVGWLYDGDYCKQSIETAGLQVYGGFYNNSTKTSPVFIIYVLNSLFILLIFFRNN